MRLTVEEFRAWESKRITLLGMSGVGKTRVAHVLRQRDWFHYSGDYRIGTRYLGEPILDNIKLQAMQVPFLRDLLRSDSIYINNNITVDHLKPVSSFLGKIGNPEQGGLPLAEFKRRQALHREAEIAAMKDVPEFIRKAREIYGYQNFVNDAGGSICELDDPEVMRVLDEHTLILYIQATEQDATDLIRRAEETPKPLYLREDFLDEQLEVYMSDNDPPYVAMIDPDDFMRWVFPRLFYARIPRYREITDRYGYKITTAELAEIRNEASFLQVVEKAIEAQSWRSADAV